MLSIKSGVLALLVYCLAAQAAFAQEEADETPAESAAPAAPAEPPAPAAKPADAVNTPPKAETAPEKATAPVAEKPGEENKIPELSPEEREHKERAEAEARAAAEKARIAEEQRREAQRSWFDRLAQNSRFLAGFNGGMVIPFNSIHKVGYGYGMTLDYLAYRRYGLHVGAETGVMSAKAQTLAATPANLTVRDDGSFGYLNLRLAALYSIPDLWGIETAAGFGVSLYQLRGGGYDFNQVLSPLGLASFYYTLLPHLQLGLITQVILASASKIITPGTDYSLSTVQWQTAASLQVSVRYAWF